MCTTVDIHLVFFLCNWHAVTPTRFYLSLELHTNIDLLIELHLYQATRWLVRLLSHEPYVLYLQLDVNGCSPWRVSTFL
jgi:hypothetical protein